MSSSNASVSDSGQPSTRCWAFRGADFRKSSAAAPSAELTAPSWLAEQLQGPVTEQRRAELGFSNWYGVDLRQQAILVDPELRAPIAQLAEDLSFARAIRLLCWVGDHEAASPLHALVAHELNSMLVLVEQRKLAVVSNNGWKFQLDVFVRGYDFWRIDELVSPEGFTIGPADFREGPLSELKNYEPPEEIEADVYGLGPRPTRRWR